LFKNNDLQIIFRYVKFTFSYREKILRCSILVFHYLKTVFKVSGLFALCMKLLANRHTSRINSVHRKTHLKKTTFSYEKNRFSLGKNVVLN